MLVEYTAGTWLKSSSKAKNIEIVNVEYSWAHVYQLRCYNQMRQVKEKYCRELDGLGTRLRSKLAICSTHWF